MAVTAYKMPVEVAFEPDLSTVLGSLETARGRIEERFLDGGNAVLAILDVLNPLVRSLDDLTKALDSETADQTAAQPSATVKQLTDLTQLETSRQDSFRQILVAQRELRPLTEFMQESLRYLRTFAVTAKITGAGVPEFAGFAEEIIQRIADGRQQVDELSRNLFQLGEGLDPVMSRGRAILQSYRTSIPAIAQGLTEGGEKISHHRKELAAHAASLKAVTARVQSKLGATLSAMQIGDATRQRIEHCQSTIAILEDSSSSLPEEERQMLDTAVRQLVSLQLRQSSIDFARETNKIVATVASFRSDLHEIGTLRRLMSDGDSVHVLRGLEQAINEARAAVRQIEAVAWEASSISRGAAETVAQLVQGIGGVQLIRTDIHYMALNTNLRCGCVGEDGKAINVVAAELRNFAAQLDQTADKILFALQSLEKAAGDLHVSQGAETGGPLDARLAAALAAIRGAAEKMETGCLCLSVESEVAEEQTSAYLARLEFDAGLGEILRECADEMEARCQTPIFVGDQAVLAEIGSRILKLYTMATERELHAQIFGASIESSVKPVSIDKDDDLLDALF